jgi:O-antigen/teichoic acid export membrane protein
LTQRAVEPGDRLRNLAQSSAAYLAGGLAGKALALVTVPILARLLAPSELGTLDVATGLASTLAILAVAGTDTAVARFLPGSHEPGRIWGSAFSVIAVVAGVLLVVGGIGAVPLGQLLLHEPGHEAAILAALLDGLAVAAYVTCLNVLRMQQASRPYALTTTVVLIAQMVGAVVLAALLADPIVAILLWWAVAETLAAVYIVLVRRPPISRPQPKLAARLLAFGAPLLPAVVGWTIGDLTIRSFLAGSAGLGALGGFSVATRLVSVMALVISGFSLAWIPFIFRIAVRTDPAERFRDAAFWLTAILGVLAVGLSGGAPELVRIIGGSGYSAGRTAIPGLAAGMILFGLYSLISAGSGLAHRTRDVAWTSAIGVAVQVGAGSVLVPTYGLAGAGAASAAGYAVALILLWGRANVGRMAASPALWALAGAITLSVAVETALVLRDAPGALRAMPLILLAIGLLAVIGLMRRPPPASTEQ